MIELRSFSGFLETQNYNNTLSETLVQGAIDTQATFQILQDSRKVTLTKTATLEMVVFYKGNQSTNYFAKS